MVPSKEQWKTYSYQESLPADYRAFRKLLETYSEIPPEEVEAHLYKIRDRAWDVAQYPCVGRFTWVRLSYFQDPEMKAAVDRLTAPGSNDTLLEMGSFVGQTIRQLVALGVDSSRLYASDLHPEFIDIGFDLFRDKDRIKAVFTTGDMLNPDDENLKQLDGKINLIHAANFFHLFTWDQQIAIGKRIVRFLPSGRVDAVLFGHHIGSVEPGEKLSKSGGGRYRHDADSFQRLWDEISSATETRWKTEVIMGNPLPIKIPGFGDDSRLVRYSVAQQPWPPAPE
ncbi:hypothetical protein GQ53DRAFT_843515 [Thozetella sp. PMI_491]|nr:hypothetical protein GQ53DRAFT_843515 [Thozetella sp. PMI_491]